MEATILVPLLIFVGKKIFEILFKWLEQKYGSDLLDLSYSNVKTLQEMKEQRLITSEEAEAVNVAALGEATAMSPPIKTGMRKFINFVTYMVFLKKERPALFDEYMQNLTKWEKKGKVSRGRTEFALMNLYVSRPDVLKKVGRG